ncbi:MAG: hypothetical protein O7G85_10575 [Planctomycetota bacterium]|nr:hypothetical protein [Planctomycetota bacterium]
MDKQIILGILLAGFISVASGCLIVSGKSTKESGTRISNTTLGQIEPGVTTESWLIATLGEPDRRSDVEGQEGVSVLLYEHCETKSDGTAVFLIFAGGSDVTRITTTYFEVDDGIVTRTWTERS